LLHPDDLARLGLKPEQRVTVTSDTGKIRGVLARPYPEIRAGNVMMYYPEANVLMHAVTDPRSGTPAFKRVPVLVRSAPGAG
jgi:anaerobic selenocysteine-containing dehydrogenase